MNKKNKILQQLLLSIVKLRILTVSYLTFFKYNYGIIHR